MKHPKIQRTNARCTDDRRESLKEIIATYGAAQILSGNWHFRTCAEMLLKMSEDLGLVHRSESGGGRPQSKTLARVTERGNYRQVLECGGPPPLCCALPHPWRYLFTSRTFNQSLCVYPCSSVIELNDR
jgi:hypothetical protein